MENKDIIKKKGQFYFSLNLKCHIKLRPIGFINGKIISEFNEEGEYFVFQDIRGFPPRRLFIEEIFDIKDYEEEVR